MEFETDRVASGIIGQKLNAAAARERKVKTPAELIRAQRAAVVGNSFVEEKHSGFCRDERLDSAAAPKV